VLRKPPRLTTDALRATTSVLTLSRETARC
jgi:hypothetical protein